MTNFVEELRWRGMIHDIMPETEEELNKGTTSGYIGFDPTSDSLHIGSLAQIMILVHFQKSGHKPYALVGGATGMVGDPSGKSQERNLLSKDVLNKNLEGIKSQLEKFLDFDAQDNAAVIVNNYDWFEDFSFLDFIRDIGKHITVNYMMAKDSVKKRLNDTGMSFTEFTYQLVQGYDFYHLWKEHNCKIQMGGSDQWGNIVTGTELIRRIGNGQAFAMTSPLITKADGSKFGKTEGGNIWLDKHKTSPYKFYQYWLNVSDEDAENYIKKFTLLSREEIETLIAAHNDDPGQRILQKTLAKDVTIRVHSEEAFNKAVEASAILFNKNATEELKTIDETTLLEVFDGVPQIKVGKSEISDAASYNDLLSNTTSQLIFKSKGEARKLIAGGGVRINKVKIDNGDDKPVLELIQNKYLIVQKGKRNQFLVIVE